MSSFAAAKTACFFVPFANNISLLLFKMRLKFIEIRGKQGLPRAGVVIIAGAAEILNSEFGLEDSTVPEINSGEQRSKMPISSHAKKH